MSPCRCLILLAALVTTVGCTTAKKTDTGGLVPPGAEFRTGLPVEPGYAFQFGYAHRWARSIDPSRGQSIYKVAQVGDLLVTIERPRNVISALNLDDGSLAWKVIIGEPLETFFGAFGNDQAVYVNSSRRIFKLQPRTGETVQVYELPRPVTMTPLLIDSMAIFGSVNGQIYGFDVDAGYRKWTYALKSRVASTPIKDGDDVFVADLSGHYAMLDADSGSLRWRGATYGPISTEPVLNGRDVVVASDDQSLYNFDSKTGDERWPVYRSEVPLNITPTVLGDVIYLVEPGQGLTAINSDTGKAIWKTEDVFKPVDSVQGLVIAHGDKTLSKIDPADGEVQQSVPTRELQTILNGPGGSLLAITPGGEIMRIDPLP